MPGKSSHSEISPIFVVAFGLMSAIGLVIITYFLLTIIGTPIAASRFYLSALKQQDQISNAETFTATIPTRNGDILVDKVRVNCKKAGQVTWCESDLPKIGHQVWVYSSSDFTDRLAFYDNASLTDVFTGFHRRNLKGPSPIPLFISLVVLGIYAWCMIIVLARILKISILAAKTYPDEKSKAFERYFANTPESNVSTFNRLLLSSMAMQRASKDIAFYLLFLLALVVFAAWVQSKIFAFASGASIEKQSLLYGAGTIAVVIAFAAPLPEVAIKYKKSQDNKVLQDTIFLTIKSVYVLLGIAALAFKAWESLYSHDGDVSIVPLLQAILKSIFS